MDLGTIHMIGVVVLIVILLAIIVLEIIQIVKLLKKKKSNNSVNEDNEKGQDDVQESESVENAEDMQENVVEEAEEVQPEPEVVEETEEVQPEPEIVEEAEEVQPEPEAVATTEEVQPEPEIVEDAENIQPIIVADVDVSDEDDEEEDDDADLNLILGEETKGVIYKKTFTAKLILTSDKNKDYYSDVINEFLSYKKVRTSMSMAGTTILLGRKRLGYVTIIGKTLKVYLAMDPDLVEDKYHVINVSEKKKYVQTPSLFKVKTDGALKKVLVLINEMLKLSKIEENPSYEKVDIAKDYPYEDPKELLEKGLIKRQIVNKDNFIKPTELITEESVNE